MNLRFELALNEEGGSFEKKGRTREMKTEGEEKKRKKKCFI